jgi:hypothetical protein
MGTNQTAPQERAPESPRASQRIPIRHGDGLADFDRRSRQRVFHIPVPHPCPAVANRRPMVARRFIAELPCSASTPRRVDRQGDESRSFLGRNHDVAQTMSQRRCHKDGVTKTVSQRRCGKEGSRRFWRSYPPRLEKRGYRRLSLRDHGDRSRGWRELDAIGRSSHGMSRDWNVACLECRVPGVSRDWNVA